MQIIFNFAKTEGLSDEDINSITACNYAINSRLSYFGNKIGVK